MSDTPAVVSAADIAPAAMPVPTSPAPSPVVTSQDVPAPGAVTLDPSRDAPASADAGGVAPGTPDAKGTPYDPARHIPRPHPRTGAWMPRGGRRPGSASAPASSPGTSAQASTAPAPESFIPSEPPPPPPDPEAKPSASAGPSAPPVADHSEDAGEVVCSAVEVIAGIVFDSPEDCTPAATEHRNMVRAVAAYIRAKGWQATAGVGLLLMFGAYLLRIIRKPKPNAVVRRWVGLDRIESAKDVTPAAAKPSPAAAPVASAPAQWRSSEIIELPRHIPPLAQ